jgi:hypothetical protein
VFPDHGDGGHWAVRRRLEHVVERGAVGVDHHRLVFLVELEDVRRGVDAIARADAQRPVDFDVNSVLR